MLTAATRPGCGMVTGIPANADGSEVPWGRTCADGTLPYLTDRVTGAGAQDVLWLSTWETSDRIVNGRLMKFGTPAADRALLAKLEESYRAITANGARLVLLTVPPRAATSQIRGRDPVDEKKTQHLNHLFHVFAGQHPQNVSVVDLAHVVCPSGPPCPAKVGGVVLRARDGGHFDGAGPAWVAPRLLRAVLAALPRSPSAATTSPTTGAP